MGLGYTGHLEKDAFAFCTDRQVILNMNNCTQMNSSRWVGSCEALCTFSNSLLNCLEISP